MPSPQNDDRAGRISSLPIDDRTGLPVPWITARLANGRPSFSEIDSQRLPELIRRRICGVCGQQLGANIAFIGGPSAARQGAFVDPPMHRECAQASLRLCPHIARRLPVHRAEGRVTPDDYFLLMCRGYTMTLMVTTQQQEIPGFVATYVRELHRYRYIDEVLTYDGPTSQRILEQEYRA